MKQHISTQQNKNLDLFFDDTQQSVSIVAQRKHLLTQYADNGIERISLHSFKAKTFANSMLEMLWLDLAPSARKPTNIDLLGVTDNYRFLDALIWVFNLNPAGADVTFEWCCENANIDGDSLDPEKIRRIIARSTRKELLRCLQIVSSSYGYEHAKECELRLIEYANLAGWNMQ